MKRRKFLKLTGIGLAVVSVAPAVMLSVVSFNSIAADLLLKEYHYLKINKGEAEKFVVDYYDHLFKNMDLQSVIMYKAKLKAHYFSNRTGTNSILIKNQAEAFLFASDFFQKGMNEKNYIKYLGLYNPYRMPCVNPFSHLYYPEKAS